MLTLESLRAWGADTGDAMKRCMNNEAFYLKLVNRAMQDPSYENLKEAVESGDLARGFEIAHALKGVTGNLALTPIDRPVREITEQLRSRTETDYSPILSEIMTKKNELTELLR